jgi:hypothetical protein
VKTTEEVPVRFDPAMLIDVAGLWAAALFGDIEEIVP